MKSILSLITVLVLAASVSSADAATLHQTAEFDNVSPKRLYQIYMSSREHSAFTGFPAEVQKPQNGGKFVAFDGAAPGGAAGITGHILFVDEGTHDPNTFVVIQTWRGFHDGPTDVDSTLTLTFRKPAPGMNDSGAEIELVQANVPDATLRVVDTSWNVRYWQPLRAYIAARASVRK